MTIADDLLFSPIAPESAAPTTAKNTFRVFELLSPELLVEVDGTVMKLGRAPLLFKVGGDFTIERADATVDKYVVIVSGDYKHAIVERVQ